MQRSNDSENSQWRGNTGVSLILPVSTCYLIIHGIYHTDSIRYFEYPIGSEPGETTSRLSI